LKNAYELGKRLVQKVQLWAGWFAGQGKKVYAFIPDKDSFEPELMYKLFTKVCVSLKELIEVLKLHN
jgi:hypothetical protein